MKLNKVYYDPRIPAGRINDGHFSQDARHGKVVFWDKKASLTPYKCYDGVFQVKEPPNAKVGFLVPVDVQEHINVTYDLLEDSGMVVRYENKVEAEKIPASPETYIILKKILPEKMFKEVDAFIIKQASKDLPIPFVDKNETKGYDSNGKPAKRWLPSLEYTYSDYLKNEPAYLMEDGDICLVKSNRADFNTFEDYLKMKEKERKEIEYFEQFSSHEEYNLHEAITTAKKRPYSHVQFQKDRISFGTPTANGFETDLVCGRIEIPRQYFEKKFKYSRGEREAQIYSVPESSDQMRAETDVYTGNYIDTEINVYEMHLKKDFYSLISDFKIHKDFKSFLKEFEGERIVKTKQELM